MEKTREITVKGIGNLKAPVDWIVIKVSLVEKNCDYEKGFSNFENNFSKLQDAIITAGFEKKDLKTTAFSVSTDYKNVKKQNEYIRVLDGYIFRNELKIEFTFEAKKVNDVLKALHNSGVTTEIDISFTVQDKEAVVNKLLYAATQNAREKAKTLCDAMGVKLGKLITINYNWTDIDIYSNVRYECEMECVGSAMTDICPDDVSVSENAVFVWEITD